MKDTWEDALLLYVPVLSGDGTVCGICGVELSDLYFRLSYPSIDSNYGGMVTVLAPIDGDELLLSMAMLGDTAGTRIEPEGVLKIKEGNYYNTYISNGERYIGLHQTLGCRTANGYELAAVTLIPEASYDSFVSANRRVWVIGSLIFLLCMLTLSLFLSRCFVRPILRSIQAIQTEPEATQHSGISEIDELLSFIQSKAATQEQEQELSKNGLPPNIEELLRSFKARVDSLTPTERSVLQYFIEGLTIEEIAERSFISIGTAKRHNTNINRKLGVSSRSELMVYIDLFRRCGRLGEITYGK